MATDTTATRIQAFLNFVVLIILKFLWSACEAVPLRRVRLRPYSVSHGRVRVGHTRSECGMPGSRPIHPNIDLDRNKPNSPTDSVEPYEFMSPLIKSEKSLVNRGMLIPIKWGLATIRTRSA